MIYQTPDAYLEAPQKAVALFGMSGLGKTRIAAMLRDEDDWFHYSIDYRIGTRYMGEHRQCTGGFGLCRRRCDLACR